MLRYDYKDRVFEVVIKDKVAHLQDIYFKNKGVTLTIEEQATLIKNEDNEKIQKILPKILTKQELELLSERRKIRRLIFDEKIIECPKERKEDREKRYALENVLRKVYYAYAYDFEHFTDCDLKTMSKECYTFVMKCTNMPDTESVFNCPKYQMLIDTPKLTDEEYDLLFRNRCILDNMLILRKKNFKNELSYECRDAIIAERRKLVDVYIKTRTFPVTNRFCVIGNEDSVDCYDEEMLAYGCDLFLKEGEYLSSNLIMLKDSILIAALEKKYDLRLNLPFNKKIFEVRFFKGDDPKQDFFKERLPKILKELDKAVVYLNTLDEEKIEEIYKVDLPRIN